MRVFLAGATGAIGRQLVPMLLGDGHQVTGMTRSEQRAQALRESGAEAVVADALDAEAVRAAVVQARPDAVVHQLTSIPQRVDPRKMRSQFELTDRLRTEGTCHLVAAAKAAGASRLIAQSVAFAYAPGPPGTVHGEQDPLIGEHAPRSFSRTAKAIASLESQMLGAGGVVLRYGYFYGAGTWIAPDGSTVEDLRRRRFPLVGDAAGVWSFIHIADAARATALALEQPASGVYNVVDDEPVAVREWLPALAQMLAAPNPPRVPTFLARLLGGEYGVRIMTQGQGASNYRAKRDLGWTPQYPSWREGFPAVLR